METFNTPKDDTLRGTGYGKLDYTNSSKLHSTAKRVQSTFNDDQQTSKQKTKSVFCSKCKNHFKIHDSKTDLPTHTKEVTKYDNHKTKPYVVITTYVNEPCVGGEIVNLGNKNLETTIIKSYKKITPTLGLISFDLEIKPKDNLLVSYIVKNKKHTKYNRPVDKEEIFLIELTVKSIVKSIKRGYRMSNSRTFKCYSTFVENIEVYFTDGSKLSDYSTREIIVI